MSMISEQVKKLKDSAYVYKAGGYPEASKLFLEAANTIEILSAKLATANMENSGGWIACKDRLPQENQRVLASFSHGAVTILTYYDKKFHGIYDYTINTILAWQPLPEPYHYKDNNNLDILTRIC